MTNGIDCKLFNNFIQESLQFQNSQKCLMSDDYPAPRIFTMLNPTVHHRSRLMRATQKTWSKFSMTITERRQKARECYPASESRSRVLPLALYLCSAVRRSGKTPNARKLHNENHAPSATTFLTDPFFSALLEGDTHHLTKGVCYVFSAGIAFFSCLLLSITQWFVE